MFGQLVIGAPGAGKSTYCASMSQLLAALRRPAVCVNLDPANEILPYKCDVDIRELITVEEAMLRLKLGPNGALRYCMRTLSKNMEWLRQKLSSFNTYLLIDLPGQLELYNSDSCIGDIIRTIEKWGHHLVAIHLSDSMYCSDYGKFISVVLSALSVTVNLEVAQVNVLSKMDLISRDLPFSEDFFTELPNLSRIVELLDENAVLSRYKAMNESICTLIDDFDLISFIGIDVNHKESMLKLLNAADLANGLALAQQPDLRNVVCEEIATS
ncbi:GPN-loop GTPase 2 [Toxocara canis]|uniref:GPN-loop GTPase 2 n=2 Tax=Toxocara canis TaxID=6265 RepID=A0A0B2VCN5_TOXCA|nr:GPN-loop GTPase 2 [Toxocara canis]VDM37618.1 unnamed protein product [Toxocara canis]